MEQIKQLMGGASTMELVNYSPKPNLISKLTKEEKQIFEAKQKSVALSKLDAAESQLIIGQLLLKIHAITGWQIPANEMLVLFIDQLQKKISESYSFLNADEIEYAFRQYGSGVKDWGKSMNIYLIDEVIEKYLIARRQVTEKEFSCVEVKTEKKELTNDDWTELLNDTREKFNTGFYSKDTLPTFIFDYLRRNNLVEYDRVKIWQKAKQLRLNKLEYQLMQIGSNRKEIKKSMDYIISGDECKSHVEYHELLLEAKKLVLVDYFKSKTTP